MAGINLQVPDPFNVPQAIFFEISRNGKSTTIKVDRTLVKAEDGFRYEAAQDLSFDDDASSVLAEIEVRVSAQAEKVNGEWTITDGGTTLKPGTVHVSKPSQRSKGGNLTVDHSSRRSDLVNDDILYDVVCQATAKLRSGRAVVNVRPKAFRSGGGGFTPEGEMTGAGSL